LKNQKSRRTNVSERAIATNQLGVLISKEEASNSDTEIWLCVHTHIFSFLGTREIFLFTTNQTFLMWIEKKKTIGSDNEILFVFVSSLSSSLELLITNA